MDPEQPQKNETPKIIGLVVLIVLALVFVIMRVMSASSQNQAPPPAVATGAAPGAPGAPAAVGAVPAGTVGGVKPAGPISPGVVRIADTEFDTGPVRTPIPQKDPNYLFFVPKNSAASPAAIRAAFSSFVTREGEVSRRRAGGTTTIANGKTSEGKEGIAAPLTHKAQIKVEGVVMGPGGFAMISMGDETYFKRAGDSFAVGYRITRLSDSGVVVHYVHSTVRNNKLATVNEPAIWPIGDPINILLPGAAPNAVQPVGGPTRPARVAPITGNSGAGIQEAGNVHLQSGTGMR